MPFMCLSQSASASFPFCSSCQTRTLQCRNFITVRRSLTFPARKRSYWRLLYKKKFSFSYYALSSFTVSTYVHLSIKYVLWFPFFREVSLVNNRGKQNNKVNTIFFIFKDGIQRVGDKAYSRETEKKMCVCFVCLYSDSLE